MSKIRQDYKKEMIEVTSLPLRDGGYTVHFFLERRGTSSKMKSIRLLHLSVSLRDYAQGHDEKKASRENSASAQRSNGELAAWR